MGLFIALFLSSIGPIFADPGACIFGQHSYDLKGRFQLERAVERGQHLSSHEKRMIRKVLLDRDPAIGLAEQFFDEGGILEYYRDQKTGVLYTRVSYYPGDNESGQIFKGRSKMADISDADIVNCTARESLANAMSD